MVVNTVEQSFFRNKVPWGRLEGGVTWALRSFTGPKAHILACYPENKQEMPQTLLV